MHGEFRHILEDSTQEFYFNTTRFSTGAPHTLAGTPSVYARVDGSATEITTGITLSADFDSKTGQSKVAWDSSASASYAAGSIVAFFIAAGTVDSVSVADIQIGPTYKINASGNLSSVITRALLALPAVEHSSSGGLPTVGTGTGQINLSGGRSDADVVRISGSATAADNVETCFTGTITTFDALDTAQDSQHSTTQAAIAVVDGVADDILVDTAEIGTAGAGLTEAGGTGDQFTAIPWNAAWDAEVQSEVDDALIAKGLDHLVFASVTGTDVADNSIVARLVSKNATADWDTYVNTTDSHEAIADALSTASGYALAAKKNAAYPDGFVIVNSTTGTTGTTLWDNGTAGTPSSTFAAAETIAAALGSNKVRIDCDFIIPAGTYNDVQVIDVAGHSVLINNLALFNAASAGGTRRVISSAGHGFLARDVIGGDSFIYLEQFWSYENLSIGPCKLRDSVYCINCGFRANITASDSSTSAYTSVFVNCWTASNGVSAPLCTFDLNGDTTGRYMFLGWDGDMAISNLDDGQSLWFTGWHKLTLNSSCTNGTIYHTSHVQVVDANGEPYSGAINLVKLTSDYGETLWTTTIATLASQVSFTLSSGPPDSGAFPAGSLVVVQDATTESQKCVGILSSYVVTGGGSTKTVALAADPGVFTMAVGDKVRISATAQAGLLNTALTESYRATGATGTLPQLLYEIMAHLGEHAISGTTKTLKKLDGSTTAKVYTLDDATSPTSITETT